jgi:hypothetical protein
MELPSFVEIQGASLDNGPKAKQQQQLCGQTIGSSIVEELLLVWVIAH